MTRMCSARGSPRMGSGSSGRRETSGPGAWSSRPARRRWSTSSDYAQDRVQRLGSRSGTGPSRLDPRGARGDALRQFRGPLRVNAALPGASDSRERLGDVVFERRLVRAATMPPPTPPPSPPRPGNTAFAGARAGRGVRAARPTSRRARPAGPRPRTPRSSSARAPPSPSCRARRQPDERAVHAETARLERSAGRDRTPTIPEKTTDLFPPAPDASSADAEDHTAGTAAPPPRRGTRRRAAATTTTTTRRRRRRRRRIDPCHDVPTARRRRQVYASRSGERGLEVERRLLCDAATEESVGAYERDMAADDYGGSRPPCRRRRRARGGLARGVYARSAGTARSPRRTRRAPWIDLPGSRRCSRATRTRTRTTSRSPRWAHTYVGSGVRDAVRRGLGVEVAGGASLLKLATRSSRSSRRACARPRARWPGACTPAPLDQRGVRGGQRERPARRRDARGDARDVSASFRADFETAGRGSSRAARARRASSPPSCLPKRGGDIELNSAGGDGGVRRAPGALLQPRARA